MILFTSLTGTTSNEWRWLLVWRRGVAGRSLSLLPASLGHSHPPGCLLCKGGQRLSLLPYCVQGFPNTGLTRLTQRPKSLCSHTSPTLSLRGALVLFSHSTPAAHCTLYSLSLSHSFLTLLPPLTVLSLTLTLTLFSYIVTLSHSLFSHSFLTLLPPLTVHCDCDSLSLSLSLFSHSTPTAQGTL